MIERYCTNTMTEIWSEHNKYAAWLRVEVAVLDAKAKMGIIPKHAADQIAMLAKFSVKRINEIDKEIHHDLLAFVQNVQEGLDGDLRRHFHADLTSYDTEEPATSILMIEAISTVLKSLAALTAKTLEIARRYQGLTRIESTHGQHAEPSTLGLMFLWWHDRLAGQKEFLSLAGEQMLYTKISGAVGTYAGGLSPELEERSLSLLGLKPAKISGQIILRDRHAHVMNALAVLAGVMENISLNIRLLGQTQICEIQEPFGRSQKGSSRMPHKKNTALTENLCGLARVVRHNAGIALENIPTWGGRDISQSSAERIIFADSFQLTHFMLERLAKVMAGLVVNEKNIQRNLEFTRGIIFSPDVKEALMAKGMDPETAYRVAQEAAFEAIERGIYYFDALFQKMAVTDLLTPAELANIFNYQNKLRHVGGIFARFK
ncbi:MAG: adenylosuccinate lyase [bacterium]|nr:adenylosuccinate lyase [bacterium]